MVSAADYTTQIQIIIILLTGVIGAKIAERIRIPIVIPLLLTGYLIGPFSPIGLNIFNPLELGVSLETFTNILVPIILFYEGLAFDVEILKRTYRPIIALATLGVVVSAFLFAYLGHYLLGLDLVSSFLIGTAVAATDVAAVEAVLRGIKVKEEILSTLVGESAFNDATAIVLVSVILGLIRTGELNISLAVSEFLRQFIGGILLGYVMGTILGTLVKRFKLEEHALYFSLILFVATYALATFILTTYSFVNPAVAIVIAGIVFREYFTEKGVLMMHGVETLSFWENIVFIAEVIIFMVLGASFSIHTISKDLLCGIILLIVAVLIVRPIAVFLSTIGYKPFSFKEKLFISLLGARGSVSAALANLILVSGIFYAQKIFNIILIITVATLLIIGFGGRKIASVLCEIRISPILVKYETFKAQYLATQTALKELARKYSEGLIDIETYNRLESELRGELSDLEREISALSDIEEMRRLREEEVLKEKRRLVEIKLRYLEHLRATSEISDEVYDQLKKRYMAEIRRIERKMIKFRRKKEKTS